MSPRSFENFRKFSQRGPHPAQDVKIFVKKFEKTSWRETNRERITYIFIYDNSILL